MESIILTAVGDILRLDPDSKVEENSSLLEGIRWHGDKCCTIEICETSTHWRIVCTGHCGTLLIVPQEVNTYARLRAYCRENNKTSTLRKIEDKLEELWAIMANKVHS